MNKLECDLQTLALIKNFLRRTSTTINDFIPDYDEEKIKEISTGLKMFESEENAMKTLSILANQTYKRIEKKFTT